MDQDEHREQDEHRDQDEPMDQDARNEDLSAKTKPIPIREAVGEPRPRPARRSDRAGNVPTSQAPGLRGQRERPEGPRGKRSPRKREAGGGRRRVCAEGLGTARARRMRVDRASLRPVVDGLGHGCGGAAPAPGFLHGGRPHGGVCGRTRARKIFGRTASTPVARPPRPGEIGSFV